MQRGVAMKKLAASANVGEAAILGVLHHASSGRATSLLEDGATSQFEDQRRCPCVGRVRVRVRLLLKHLF